jgi:hypothetical protein
MVSRFRSRLSYANVMATFAVFCVLGGVSYAAVGLAKNSVGSKQIQKNAVRSSEAKNLKCSDFKKGQGACGDVGLTNVTTRSTTVTLPLSNCNTSGAPASTFCRATPTLVTANCAAGEKAVGGGYENEDVGNTTNPTIGGRLSQADGINRPEPATGTPTGWTVRGSGSALGPGATNPQAPAFTVYAVCAS